MKNPYKKFTSKIYIRVSRAKVHEFIEEQSLTRVP